MPGGWHHAAQGVRIVEVLEQLNLTWEVRDGIRAHSWKIDPPPATREGECVRYADRIGYLSHDALDAVRAGVLRVGDLPARARDVFGEPGSAMVGAMIDAVVEGSLSPANTAGAVVMAPEAARGDARAAGVHVRAGYESDTAAGQKHVAIDVIRRLVDHHLAHPELHPGQLPRHRGRPGHPGRRLRLRDDRPVRPGTCTTGSSTPTPPRSMSRCSSLR